MAHRYIAKPITYAAIVIRPAMDGRKGVVLVDVRMDARKAGPLGKIKVCDFAEIEQDPEHPRPFLDVLNEALSQGRAGILKLAEVIDKKVAGQVADEVAERGGV